MNHSSLLNWNSCGDLLNSPQAVDVEVKRLHIYDFDNTLYNSPHPNRELYEKPLLTQLTNSLLIKNLSWWMLPSILKQSFDDMLNSDAKEKYSYWNTDTIKAAQESFSDSETVSILLTGRKEHLFASILTGLFTHFNEVKFNGYCLRRESIGSSTNEYKTTVILDLIKNYPSLEEVVLYDDRLGQVKQFRNFFNGFSHPFACEVIHIPPRSKQLKAADETRLIENVFSNIDKDMGVSLRRMPKQYGYFLTRQSSRSLLNLSYSFLQKKYKMSDLPFYPLFIPCAEKGECIPKFEIAKILSNNEEKTIQSSSKSEALLREFEEQADLDLTGSCIIQFDVIQIGIQKKRDSVNILYKAKLSDRKRYVWSAFQEWIIINDDGQTFKDPLKTIPIEKLFQEQSQSFRWVRLRNPLKVKTFLGYHARLTLVKT